MTAKRNFKRRVRERQARTGESYTAARAKLLAARAASLGDDSAVRADASPAVVPVVELVDISAEATRLGFACRVAMFPALVKRAEPASVLATLHAALVGTEDDPATAVMRGVALRGRRDVSIRRATDPDTLRRFFQRARAGLGGAADDGTMLALQVAGRDGMVPVLCSVWRRELSLVVMTLDGPDDVLLDYLYLTVGPRPPPTRHPSVHVPTLFLIFNGRRYPVTRNEFVIGRNPRVADVQIKDGVISRKHAAVIRRNDTFYIKDLGSICGIFYKGMRIDNKRIDEGDVFHLASHELRFTFRVDG
jgi:hypothetical protein